MRFILSPIATMNAPKMQISIDGLVVTINGQEYDLSVIPEGGQAEATEDSPFLGVITREQVTIKYGYDMALAEDNQSLDWADYTFEVTEGEVPCPIKWRPEPEPEPELPDFGFEEGEGELEA
ncbi:TPA: hypothetical protein ACGFXK_002551 [Vibrio cholerae]